MSFLKIPQLPQGEPADLEEHKEEINDSSDNEEDEAEKEEEHSHRTEGNKESDGSESSEGDYGTGHGKRYIQTDEYGDDSEEEKQQDELDSQDSHEFELGEEKDFDQGTSPVRVSRRCNMMSSPEQTGGKDAAALMSPPEQLEGKEIATGPHNGTYTSFFFWLAIIDCGV